MTPKPWQMTLTIASLFAASVLLSGCPKKPAPAAGTSPGSGAGPTVTEGAGSTAGGSGDAGGSGTGTMGSGPGSTGGLGAGTTAGGAGGGTGAGAGAGAGTGMGSGAGAGAGSTEVAGGAGATGTTIPTLPSPKEFVESSSLRDVRFDFDKTDVRPQDKPILDENAAWLKANTNALVLIEGHCDERGTNEYNLALGERRAKSTRDYLVSVGVEAARITVIGYGKERPLCNERAEACWAQNRRAHFLVK